MTYLDKCTDCTLWSDFQRSKINVPFPVHYSAPSQFKYRTIWQKKHHRCYAIKNNSFFSVSMRNSYPFDILKKNTISEGILNFPLRISRDLKIFCFIPRLIRKWNVFQMLFWINNFWQKKREKSSNVHLFRIKIFMYFWIFQNLTLLFYYLLTLIKKDPWYNIVSQKFVQSQFLKI